MELPRVQAPVANDVPTARAGNLVFLAGMGPVRPDGSVATGRVGRDLGMDEAYAHARLTALPRSAVSMASPPFGTGVGVA